MRRPAGIPLSPRLRDLLGLDHAPATDHPLTGAQRLCLAVLADALHVLYTTRHLTGSHELATKGVQLRTAALRWFQCEDDGPFAFTWVCAMLPHLDPDAIRAQLDANHWVGSAHTHHTHFMASGSGKRAFREYR